MSSSSVPYQTLNCILGKKCTTRVVPADHTSLILLGTKGGGGCILRKQGPPSHFRTPLRPLSARSSIQPNEVQGYPEPLSPLTKFINAFYSSINQKDLRKLKEVISKECTFEDVTYSKPLQGEVIHQFYKKLTHNMGEHVRFVIDDISEGYDSTITVIWHLEWKNMFIPFTKGCSFFMCSRDKERILIKEARVFVESPVKPGDLSLEMLKIITTLFDKFPSLAERFLQKPDAIIQFVIKLYKMFVEPFILPLLMFYARTWTYVAGMLWYAFSILQNVLKLFM